MGRYETLNDDTKDLVNCLLPALAASFKINDAVEIIPEDIRMRAWDCEKRDHIKDQTENDPRNWGVQFLKDLKAISRLKNGNLAEFQADLRAKVALHEPKHPWARLGDIKEIKNEYENPGLKDIATESSSEESSVDSYFEELVELEDPRGKKRRNTGNHEVYEARVLEKRKKHKPNRLRRAESGGFERIDKSKKKRYSVERETTTPKNRQTIRRKSRTVLSDDEESFDESSRGRSLNPHHTPAFSASPVPGKAHMYAVESVDTSNEPLAVQKLQAELEVAEAELNAARIRFQYIQAKEVADKERQYGGKGSRDTPHTFH